MSTAATPDGTRPNSNEWVTTASARRREPPTLAVFKFASCDGCQLSLLDCEDELFALAGAVRIANFAEMSSATIAGPYDVVLVEGSVTTPADARRIHAVRAAAGTLVTIGACATAGGIQALRNFADEPELARQVYAHPEYIETLATSTPISDHVAVDYELRGCPVAKDDLLETVSALLAGRRPLLRTHAVCEDCKRAGLSCVLVSGTAPCLGPVTRAGCGALCPAVGRGCYGCFGPAESANTPALARTLIAAGASAIEVRRLFRTFNAAAPAFAAESRAHEHD